MCFTGRWKRIVLRRRLNVMLTPSEPPVFIEVP